MTVDQFVNEWNGKPLDTDGFPPSQPYQCYDVPIKYIRELTGNPNWYFTATLTGLAQDFYNQYDSSSLLQAIFDKLPWNANGQPGDVAVWGESAQTPSSHVAILLADNGNTQHIFGQNQPYPYCTVRDLTSVGLLGYLRPKANNQPSQPAQAQGGEDMIDQGTLTVLYQAMLGRDPDPGAISHYVGNYATSFVVNDLNTSAEHTQHMQLLAGQLSSLTAQLNQAQADRQAAIDMANQAKTDTSTAQGAEQDLQTKLDAANAKVTSLQAQLDAATKAAQATTTSAQPAQGFAPTVPVALESTAVTWIASFIKQVIGASK